MRPDLVIDSYTRGTTAVREELILFILEYKLSEELSEIFFLLVILKPKSCFLLKTYI